jgi:hypothetical protein
MKYLRRVITWAQTTILLRPVRAMIIAYSYVLTGTKVEHPMKWSDI